MRSDLLEHRREPGLPPPAVGLCFVQGINEDDQGKTAGLPRRVERCEHRVPALGRSKPKLGDDGGPRIGSGNILTKQHDRSKP
jgi:hypothetical protein